MTCGEQAGKFILLCRRERHLAGFPPSRCGTKMAGNPYQGRREKIRAPGQRYNARTLGIKI